MLHHALQVIRTSCIIKQVISDRAVVDSILLLNTPKHIPDLKRRFNVSLFQ